MLSLFELKACFKMHGLEITSVTGIGELITVNILHNRFGLDQYRLEVRKACADIQAYLQEQLTKESLQIHVCARDTDNHILLRVHLKPNGAFDVTLGNERLLGSSDFYNWYNQEMKSPFPTGLRIQDPEWHKCAEKPSWSTYPPLCHLSSHHWKKRLYDHESFNQPFDKAFGGMLYEWLGIESFYWATRINSRSQVFCIRREALKPFSEEALIYITSTLEALAEIEIEFKKDIVFESTLIDMTFLWKVQFQNGFQFSWDGLTSPKVIFREHESQIIDPSDFFNFKPWHLKPILGPLMETMFQHKKK